MLVSVVQQCESAICRHISPPSSASLLLPLPIHLGHHRTSSRAPYIIQQAPTSSVLHMVVYIWQCYSLSSPHPPLPPWVPKPVLYVFISGRNFREQGLPWWLSWLRVCLQCGRPGFDLWVGKIPWSREWLPTPVFWSGEFHGVHSPWGDKELDTTEWLSLHFHLESKLP